MKISGFTMVKNADKYFFPIKESVLSILPLVNEFVIALGNCDADDRTRELIDSIGSEKIRIINRVWYEKDFIKSKIFADETNFALSQCSGNWCFYLQADEVVHEKHWTSIINTCQQHLNTPEIDGLLFKYHHFFGDYHHYLPFHGWYKNEIRIVRNYAGIYSFKDAQSFRKKNHKKLNVTEVDAHIYHYGWVRPPEVMQSKKKAHDSMHHGREKTDVQYEKKANYFDFGALGVIPVFRGTHPAVMQERIRHISWADRLNYSKKAKLSRPLAAHEKTKYKLLSWIEKNLLGGREIFGYNNWKKIK